MSLDTPSAAKLTAVSSVESMDGVWDGVEAWVDMLSVELEMVRGDIVIELYRSRRVLGAVHLLLISFCGDIKWRDLTQERRLLLETRQIC